MNENVMIGKIVAHYKILEKLGEGGMGIVYKAEDTKLQRTVALKFLRPQTLTGDENRMRFLREARAAAALDHPNICTVYEVNESDDLTYISMAYIEGQSLRDRVKAGPLDLAEALDIAVQTGLGLKAAHERGIIHRDIKSANIMVTPEGRVQIMDFGLAKPVGATKVTKTGTMLGTAAYMSPEQALGQETDERTDIWSLGVVLYELLTGQMPFKGDYDSALVYSIVNENSEPVTDLRPDVPLEIERVVAQALEKDLEKRYQSVGELLDDLEKLRESLELLPRRGRLHRQIIRQRKRIALVIGAAIVVIVAILGGIHFFSSRAEAIDSLAVLPLDNLSGDEEQEYFAEGMTEALIAELSKISALKVISRTSVMRYKETVKPLPDIARELNVKAVVEGSVLRAGERIRITAQLIHAGTDRHIWADHYERDFKDVITLQREVAQAIARKIKIELTPQEGAQLERAPEVDPTAQEAYLKGRYYWNKRTDEALQKSIDYFELAIDREPGYALAYAGLADAYVVLGDWGFLTPTAAFPRAKETAMKALEIDSELAEAHAALAYVAYFFDGQWQHAENEFKRAVELNPNYATAHQRYALYLLWLMRYDEALEEIDRAIELDPLSMIISIVRGFILYYAGHYKEALEQFGVTLDMDPDFYPAHFALQTIYLNEGIYDKAVEEIERISNLSGMSGEDIGAMRKAYETSGIDGVYRWQLEMLEGLSERQYVDPFNFAMHYAVLGENDKAFEWIEKMYEEQSFMGMFMLRLDRRLDTFRRDPRFADCMKRIGLEE